MYILASFVEDKVTIGVFILKLKEIISYIETIKWESHNFWDLQPQT